MYYIFVGWAGAMFSLGLIRFRFVFYQLVEGTTGMLNTILDTLDDDDTKQKKLIVNLGKVLTYLAQLILAAIVVVAISVLPIWLFSKLFGKPVNDLDLGSFWFYLALSVGSIIVFWIYSKSKKTSDYSEWSQLLHRIILNNYNISRSLFSLEKFLYKSKAASSTSKFVIISGLARAGTTAFTKVLYESEEFYSLSYANMPFLLSPNLWRYVYNPKQSKLKERSHGDKVLFGYNTIEALEEYFWKTELHDQFIGTNAIKEHKISKENYNNYTNYQGLIRPKKQDGRTYLAKNNNFLLRYDSMRAYNPNFVLLLLFRDPISHATSLLSQHIRQIALQEKDKFVQEFMDWLGHHEFGLNHKVFQFEGSTFQSKFEKDSVNYWIEVWSNYYSRVLEIESTSNLFLISYEDFLLNPKKVLESIGDKLGINLASISIDKFKKNKANNLEIDSGVADRASKIYTSLLTCKMRIELIQNY